MPNARDPDFDNRPDVYRALGARYASQPVVEAANEIAAIVRRIEAERGAQGDREAAARLFLHCALREWDAAHDMSTAPDFLRRMADEIENILEEARDRKPN